MRNINKIVIHCSDSDVASHDNIETIRQWHTDPKPRGNGWSDVGYHYFIKWNGDIELGRPLDISGAHVRGHNNDSIGICLHGRRKFTIAQFTTLRRLILKEKWEHQISDENVFGHRDLDMARPPKTCPNFDYKRVLSIDWDEKPLDEMNKLYKAQDFLTV